MASNCKNHAVLIKISSHGRHGLVNLEVHGSAIIKNLSETAKSLKTCKRQVNAKRCPRHIPRPPPSSLNEIEHSNFARMAVQVILRTNEEKSQPQKVTKRRDAIWPRTFRLGDTKLIDRITGPTDHKISKSKIMIHC